MSTITNLPLEGDGVIENLYYYLWSKDEFDRSPNFFIPDTVLYEYTQPVQWYFTSSSGRIKRKLKANTVNGKIEREFTKNSIGNNIVAYYLYKNETGESLIEYFDEAGLHDFLYNRTKTNNGILQKFIEPKGVSNSMIRAIWSPKLCMLERRINVHKLHDSRHGLYERAVTFEGPDYHSTTGPVKGQMLAGGIQHTCDQVVNHISEVTFQKFNISRMVMNLKLDSQDNVWLMWCSSLRLEHEEHEHTTLINMETGVKLPSNVQLKPMSHSAVIHKNINFQPCASCALNIDDTKIYGVNYKAILCHFELLLQHMHQAVGDDEDNEASPEPIEWPPSASVIEAAGGVGFGILELIEVEFKNPNVISEIEVAIPPTIRFLHPAMELQDYKRYKKDPIFLSKQAPVCESCFLVYADYSTSALESNSVRRDAPSILRPKRAGLTLLGKLRPLDGHSTRRQRRTPANTWSPVTKKRGHKIVLPKAEGMLPFMPTPEIPSVIDPRLVREMNEAAADAAGGRVNNYSQQSSPSDTIRPVTHGFSPASSAVGRERTPATASSSTAASVVITPISSEVIIEEEDANQGWAECQTPEEAPDSAFAPKLKKREEDFFTELYSNPNIDKSHPLSHMIESAARIESMAPRTNTALGYSASMGSIDSGPDSFDRSLKESVSGTQLPPMYVESQKKRQLKVQRNPYDIKQKLIVPGKVKKKASKKSRTKGANRNSNSNSSLSKAPAGVYTDDAVEHQEFLLKTMGDIREQMAKAKEVTLAEIIESTTSKEDDEKEEDEILHQIVSRPGSMIPKTASSGSNSRPSTTATPMRSQASNRGSSLSSMSIEESSAFLESTVPRTGDDDDDAPAAVLPVSADDLNGSQEENVIEPANAETESPIEAEQVLRANPTISTEEEKVVVPDVIVTASTDEVRREENIDSIDSDIAATTGVEIEKPIQELSLNESTATVAESNIM